tara:strand:+ start:106 stop:369 length:264 start_codon:yes stop_codon:yes gene_type:complete
MICVKEGLTVETVSMRLHPLIAIAMFFGFMWIAMWILDEILIPNFRAYSFWLAIPLFIGVMFFYAGAVDWIDNRLAERAQTMRGLDE